jgi:hypothetical protein
MKHQQNKLLASRASKRQLALQAIERDATLNQRHAAKIYDVPQTILDNQNAGSTYRCNCTPNSMKLLNTEEEVILQHILNLDAREPPPWLAGVEDTADSLFAEHHRDPVGQNWAATFVKRCPGLKVKFNQKNDYERALCEDPEAIRGWFQLVETKKAKYSIQNEDMYNSNKSGLTMGMISTGAIVTGAER